MLLTSNGISLYTMQHAGPPNIRTLKFVVGPFVFDSILVTEGSVLDPQYYICR